MTTLINNVLLKTRLLQTIAQSNNGEFVLKIDWVKTSLNFIILILVIITAFILKARYVRWKNRRQTTNFDFNFPPSIQNHQFHDQ